MSSSLSNLFSAAEETHREMPMDPMAYGAIAIVAFFALLGVLWFFRGTAQKIGSGGHAHTGADDRH
jgi:hypothetical protein